MEHPHLRGLVRAFTKYRSTCLQGAQGSELRPALERGRRSENLRGGGSKQEAVNLVALPGLTRPLSPRRPKGLS